MLCNYLWLLKWIKFKFNLVLCMNVFYWGIFLICKFHHVVQLFVNWLNQIQVQSCFVHGNNHHLGSVSSMQWISPCCAIYEFHHVLQLFVNFTILCYCGHEVLLRSCFGVVAMLYGLLGCVILFVNFTMLCNWLWIWPCCAIVCEFHHVVQLLTIIVLNEEYFLKTVTNQPTNRTISRVATATKKERINLVGPHEHEQEFHFNRFHDCFTVAYKWEIQKMAWVSALMSIDIGVKGKR